MGEHPSRTLGSSTSQVVPLASWNQCRILVLTDMLLVANQPLGCLLHFDIRNSLFEIRYSEQTNRRNQC